MNYAVQLSQPWCIKLAAVSRATRFKKAQRANSFNGLDIGQLQKDSNSLRRRESRPLESPDEYSKESSKKTHPD